MKLLSTVSGLPDGSTENRYFWLQLFLCLIHWGVALALVILAALNDCETFKTEFNFRYNVWNPKEGADETCDGGCTLSKNTYTFAEKLNINVLVAFFSFVSGTNHAIQAYWTLQDYATKLASRLNWVRFVDFGVSAGLMVIANAILFYVPPDLQTLTLWFVYQCLTQLGGYASEVLLEKGEREAAFNVFCVSGILYIVPWALLFATFAMTTQKDLLGTPDVNTPPIQVWFFLGWIFQTFMLFPVATYYKILANQGDAYIKWEIVNSLLSFIAKLPLLAVFAGGSFQRGLFTELKDDDFADDGCPSTDDNSGRNGNVYAVLFVPMAASLIGAMGAVFVFAKELDLVSTRDAFTTLGITFCSLFLVTLIALFPSFLVFGIKNPTAVIYIALVVPPAIFTALWRFAPLCTSAVPRRTSEAKYKTLQ